MKISGGRIRNIEDVTGLEVLRIPGSDRRRSTSELRNDSGYHASDPSSGNDVSDPG
jgi:hypothetical protein